MKNEAISIAEQTQFLAKRGCFIARTPVDPKDEDIVMSVINLSDEAVKVNQNTVIGSLQEVEQVYNSYTDKANTLDSNATQLPAHLQTQVQNAS